MPAPRLALALLVLLLAGCAGSPWQPDVLSVRNARDAAVLVDVQVLDAEGAVIHAESVSLAPREAREISLSRLSGPHVLVATVGEETARQEVRLERIREYLNVEVGDTLQLHVLHGD